MTGREFYRTLSNGDVDMVGVLLRLLADTDADYCVIGGLGVNAYADPVVSLDLDLVVVADRIGDMRAAAESGGMKVEEFAHSVNLTMPGSDLRVQLQTDPRYQEFLPRREQHDVLGYSMFVASVRDVLRGKVWAYSDRSRRASKRQKDLADIMRLVETRPGLRELLPPEVEEKLE